MQEGLVPWLHFVVCWLFNDLGEGTGCVFKCCFVGFEMHGGLGRCSV